MRAHRPNDRLGTRPDSCRRRLRGKRGHGLKRTNLTARAAGIAMAFKLIEAAEHRWRAVDSAHRVALVRAGAKFENGVLVE